MKKNLAMGMAALFIVAATLAGCGYDDSSKDVTKVDVDKYVTSIGDYSNLSITVDPLMPIGDDEVEGYINYVLNGQSENVKSDKTEVETGDIVNIDYEGIKDGVAFEGGTAQGVDLTIGSGTFIAGFEDGLIGHKVGEDVELNLTFPENYANSELAGQDVIFKVKINHISETKVPELTDELVQGYNIENVSNIEEYREFVNNELNKAADDTFLSAKRDAVQQALTDQCTFADVKGLALYQYYYDQLMSQAKNTADQYGMSVEDVVAGMYGIGYEEYEASIASQAEKLVQGVLACQKVAKKEKIKISDEEIEQQMIVDAEDFGYSNVDEFRAAITDEDYKNYLLQKKVVDKLLETAVVTEQAAE